MNNQAIDILIKQRELVIAQRAQAIEELSFTISDIEAAIEKLSGKKVWEFELPTKYDDENPNYIKSSLEEI